jgi:hypothetical protein
MQSLHAAMQSVQGTRPELHLSGESKTKIRESTGSEFKVKLHICPLFHLSPVLRMCNNWVCRVAEDTLSTILGRLQRVEEQCLPLAKAVSIDERPLPASSSGPSLNQSSVSSVSSPATASPGGHHIREKTWSLPERAHYPNLDATAVLKEATDQAQKARLRSIQRLSLNAELSIPRQMAKIWVKCRYYRCFSFSTGADLPLSRLF